MLWHDGHFVADITIKIIRVHFVFIINALYNRASTGIRPQPGMLPSLASSLSSVCLGGRARCTKDRDGERLMLLAQGPSSRGCKCQGVYLGGTDKAFAGLSLGKEEPGACPRNPQVPNGIRETCTQTQC